MDSAAFSIASGRPLRGSKAISSGYSNAHSYVSMMITKGYPSFPSAPTSITHHSVGHFRSPQGQRYLSRHAGFSPMRFKTGHLERG